MGKVAFCPHATLNGEVNMDGIAHILSAVTWPIVVLTVFLVFRSSIKGLLARLLKIKASSKGVELVLEELEKEGQLPIGSRTELAGLSAHEIWALDDFTNQRIAVSVSQMKPAQRVAARTLRDAGLLTVQGEGPDRKIAATPLGLDILRAANSLL